YTVRHDSQFRHPAQEGLQVGPFLALLAAADEEGRTTPEPHNSSQQLSPARFGRKRNPCPLLPGRRPGCGPGDVTGATPPPDPRSWPVPSRPNAGPTTPTGLAVRLRRQPSHGG